MYYRNYRIFNINLIRTQTKRQIKRKYTYYKVQAYIFVLNENLMNKNGVKYSVNSVTTSSAVNCVILYDINIL